MHDVPLMNRLLVWILGEVASQQGVVDDLTDGTRQMAQDTERKT